MLSDISFLFSWAWLCSCISLRWWSKAYLFAPRLSSGQYILPTPTQTSKRALSSVIPSSFYRVCTVYSKGFLLHLLNCLNLQQKVCFGRNCSKGWDLFLNFVHHCTLKLIKVRVMTKHLGWESENHVLLWALLPICHAVQSSSSFLQISTCAACPSQAGACHSAVQWGVILGQLTCCCQYRVLCVLGDHHASLQSTTFIPSIHLSLSNLSGLV